MLSRRQIRLVRFGHGRSLGREAFYEKLAGYTPEEVSLDEKAKYLVMKQEQKPRAGIVKNPWQGVRSNWLAYVLVDDPKAVAERAQALGGKIVFGPDDKVKLL